MQYRRRRYRSPRESPRLRFWRSPSGTPCVLRTPYTPRLDTAVLPWSSTPLVPEMRPQKSPRSSRSFSERRLAKEISHIPELGHALLDNLLGRLAGKLL